MSKKPRPPDFKHAEADAWIEGGAETPCFAIGLAI
jgi:hypothetical protein